MNSGASADNRVFLLCLVFSLAELPVVGGFVWREDLLSIAGDIHIRFGGDEGSMPIETTSMGVQGGAGFNRVNCEQAEWGESYIADLKTMVTSLIAVEM